jgi:hypothetical protein
MSYVFYWLDLSEGVGGVSAAPTKILLKDAKCVVLTLSQEVADFHLVLYSARDIIGIL